MDIFSFILIEGIILAIGIAIYNAIERNTSGRIGHIIALVILITCITLAVIFLVANIQVWNS